MERLFYTLQQTLKAELKYSFAELSRSPVRTTHCNGII